MSHTHESSHSHDQGHDHAHDHAHDHTHDGSHDHTHDQAHEHAHDHAHAGGHHHHHHEGEDDPYYLDQLCQIALTSAFGGICLLLYFVRTDMLDLMLSVRFTTYVLLGGITLLVLSILRAYSLWRQSKTEAACCAHDHHHDHAHEHTHDHGHEHTHDQGHAHTHDHHGHHHHAHDGHGHDHTHGWAPWRYVVLMVPVILFVLGLPNKAPSVDAPTGNVDDETIDAPGVARMVTLPAEPMAQLAVYTAMRTGAVHFEGQEVFGVSFKRLFESSRSKTEQDYLHGKRVRIGGLYRSIPDKPNVAFVARFLRQCCSADAVPITIPIIARKRISEMTQSAPRDGEWVSVSGRIDYHDGRLRIILSKIIPTGRPEESYFIDN